jgi:hypothetical protein
MILSSLDDVCQQLLLPLHFCPCSSHRSQPCQGPQGMAGDHCLSSSRTHICWQNANAPDTEKPSTPVSQSVMKEHKVKDACSQRCQSLCKPPSATPCARKVPVRLMLQSKLPVMPDSDKIGNQGCANQGPSCIRFGKGSTLVDQCSPLRHQG